MSRRETTHNLPRYTDRLPVFITRNNISLEKSKKMAIVRYGTNLKTRHPKSQDISEREIYISENNFEISGEKSTEQFKIRSNLLNQKIDLDSSNGIRSKSGDFRGLRLNSKSQIPREQLSRLGRSNSRVSKLLDLSRRSAPRIKVSSQKSRQNHYLNSLKTGNTLRKGKSQLRIKRPENSQIKPPKMSYRFFEESPVEQSVSKRSMSVPQPVKTLKVHWKRQQSRESITNLFSFKEVIGQGSFSKVYRARYRQDSDRIVAIKIMAKKNFDSRKKRVLVEREVEILGVISHPNFSELFDVLEDSTNVDSYLI